MKGDTTGVDGVLAGLLSRRSVSPKRLTGPAPDRAELGLMVQAALRAPDHGGLHPWRIVEFRAAERPLLAGLFEQEKLRRDPLASPSDRAKAREHATRPPTLLGFLFCPQPRTQVPPREQMLAAGAALGNLLNAAHQLGYGASILSGERCFDPVLLRQLGLGADEVLAGFISIGTVREAPPPARPPASGTVWSCWTPPLEAQRPMADAPPAEPPSGDPGLATEGSACRPCVRVRPLVGDGQVREHVQVAKK